MVSELAAISVEDGPHLVPVVIDGMPVAQAGELAKKLKAIAEPTRLRLLSLVAAHDGQEACVCDLTAPVNLSQPTVSHHLKLLVEAGLLTRTQRGSWAYYALVPGALDELTELLRASVAAPPHATDIAAV